MKALVENEVMKRAMSTFVLKFKEILKYTQPIQKQFMSVRIQDVNDFRKNRDNLRRAIVDLVDFSKRTFGEDNKLSLPSTLKCLSLFLYGMIDLQLEHWKNIGALDEQNNESAHAQMNNVQTLFGASRGDNQKKMTIDRLLLRCNPQLSKGITELLSATGMKDETKEKYKLARERRKAREEEENREENKEEVDDEEEEVEEEEDYTKALHDNEKAMNENDLLRIPEGFEHEDAAMVEALQSMDTKLHVCPKCSPRKVLLGKESMRLHIQECHNEGIQAEHDAIDGRIK